MAQAPGNNPVANQNLQQSRSDYNAFDFFVYEMTFDTLLAATAQTGTFTIQAEADFLLSKMVFFASIAGADQTDSSRVIPAVSVVISDTGSGRNLMDSGVPVSSIFGYGDLPFILPRQRVFIRSSVVNITVSNFSAGTDYDTLRLSFIGEKAFKY
jgi:hypothetical protein